MKLKSYFFIVLLLLAGEAFSQKSMTDCQPVDIRDQMSPKLKEHFSIPRDQSDVGWCYAFTVADLFSAEEGRVISSIHVATNYNRGIRKNPITRLNDELIDFFGIGEKRTKSYREGGFVRRTLQISMKNKFLCEEKAVPFTPGSIGGTSSQLAFLDTLENFLRARNGQRVNLYDLPQFCEQKIVNPFLIDDYQFIADEILNNHRDIALANIIDRGCPDKSKVPIGNYRAIKRINPRNIIVSDDDNRNRERDMERNENRWFAQLGDVLENGKPVALDFDMRPFWRYANKESNEPYYHASAITARRWHNGSCQYKIRNSWGEGCGSYVDEIKARCNSEEGSFWLTSEELLETSREFNFLKER